MGIIWAVTAWPLNGGMKSKTEKLRRVLKPSPEGLGTGTNVLKIQ